MPHHRRVNLSPNSHLGCLRSTLQHHTRYLGAWLGTSDQLAGFLLHPASEQVVLGPTPHHLLVPLPEVPANRAIPVIKRTLSIYFAFPDLLFLMHILEILNHRVWGGGQSAQVVCAQKQRFAHYLMDDSTHAKNDVFSESKRYVLCG